MEKTILIKSEKLDLKRFFRLLWTVVFFIICIALITTLKQYFDYKKCQNFVVNTLIETTSRFDEYDNDERVQRMYYYLKPLTRIYGRYDNSELVRAAEEFDRYFGVMLRERGWENAIRGSDYLLAYSYIDYLVLFDIVSPVISLFMLIIAFSLNMWCMKKKTEEIIVTENSVFINNRNQELLFPIEKIHSIDVLFMNCLSIFADEKKQKVYFLKNAQDIKHILTEKMLPEEI